MYLEICIVFLPECKFGSALRGWPTKSYQDCMGARRRHVQTLPFPESSVCCKKKAMPRPVKWQGKKRMSIPNEEGPVMTFSEEKANTLLVFPLASGPHRQLAFGEPWQEPCAGMWARMYSFYPSAHLSNQSSSVKVKTRRCSFWDQL